MARYSHLNDLHSLEFKTLAGIHEALGIKQGLKNYVRNTNKKYSKNYAEDEVLMNEVADIIILNTLGKLKRHNEQAKYIDLMAESKEDTALIEKATQYAELSNLADAIINQAKVMVKLDLLDTIENSKVIGEIMYQKGVPNAKYFSPQGKIQWFKDNMDYLINSYEVQK